MMAKDPAFLFYTSDFLTGTMTMNNEQVGKYIRLLCLQHQKGILTEKDMLFICQSYDEDIYSKFIQSKDGFYNERLRLESEKRALYSLSRASNRSKLNKKQSKKHMKKICKSYVQHMENENVNINIDINKNNKNKKPSIDEIKSYCLERKNKVNPENFFNYYESNGWRVGKNPMKDWRAAVRTWEKNNFNTGVNDGKVQGFSTNSYRRNNHDRPGLDADTAAECDRIAAKLLSEKTAVHDTD